MTPTSNVTDEMVDKAIGAYWDTRKSGTSSNNSRRAMRAALEAALSSAMQGWRPIAEAPRDGTVFLGYEDGVIGQMSWNGWKGEIQHWKLDGYCWHDESRDAWPTHFMQLPPPPEKK